MSSIDSSRLTNTLVLALTQCQEQLQSIHRQAVRIEQLQQENQSLRRELEEIRSTDVNHVETQPSVNIQDLFQRNIDAQAEIHRLSRKLKAYKDKANGRLSIPLSSPVPTSPTFCLAPRPGIARTTASDAAEPSNTKRTASGRSASPPTTVSRSLPASPPRKRQRASSADARDTLTEVPVNILSSETPTTSASKQNTIERKVAAIPFIAEDGDNHSMDAVLKATPRPFNGENPAVRRLDALLTDPSPVKSPLLRTKTSTASPQTTAAESRPSEARLSRISHINHVSNRAGKIDDTDRLQSRPENPVLDMREPKKVNVQESFRSRPSSRTSGTSASRSRTNRDPEDDEPFRARPIQRLSAQHFKPNPRWLDSHGMSYDEFLYGRQGERIKALAETLPNLPGQSMQEEPATDHELLLDLLGPASEGRIAKLTPAARNNLLLEARTKRVAQAYAKQRQDYDKDKDVPGFWMADMPGTQEDEENRVVAKQRERDEVKRRYEDAMRGGGRWVFADE